MQWRKDEADTMIRRILLIGALLLAGCQTDLPLVDLKERYGGPPSRFLPMDGFEVHWRDEGPGRVARTDAPAAAAAPGAPASAAAEPPTVLLLHGTAASLHTWDGWVEQMSPEFRVVRLDLPGFGLTGPHPSGDYSAAATTDFLERFAAAAGLKRFAVVGHSLGGYYAWRYALRHPEQVSALVLIDSAGYPIETSSSTAVALQVARMPVISELIRWAPIRGAVRRSLLDVYVDDGKVTPALVNRYTDLMLRPGNRAAFGDRARAAPRASGYQRLTELSVPTLILWGEQDRWIPVGHAERFHADIRGSTLVRYPDLGHLPMEEDPGRTAREAIAFLRRVAAAEPPTARPAAAAAAAH
jgi:pimeloyl-ACP methyl ester carboxylesterase